MELFMKYPQEVQEELLRELISTAQNTEMGIRYGFKNIKNYQKFKAEVPLSSYESIASQIERCRNGTQNIFWPSPIITKNHVHADKKQHFVMLVTVFDFGFQK